MLPLADTFCERVFATQQTLAFSNAEASVWSDHPAKLALGFGSYLGTVVRVGDERFGTLCFASSEAAHAPFTATQRDLVSLLAQWVGFEIDRAVASKIAWSETAAEKLFELEHGEVPPDLDIEIEPVAPRARERESERVTPRALPAAAKSELRLDVNAALEEMRSLLAQSVGEEIELTLTFATDLHPARVSSLAFRRLVLGIVKHAVMSMPAGGELELETGRVGPAEHSNEPRSDSPSGFVTLAVRDSGGDVDPDDIGVHFEAALRIERDDPTPRSNGATLSLAEVERIVRSVGGDLSLAVEPGLGTTYTVFLPETPLTMQAAITVASPELTHEVDAPAGSRDAAEAPAPETQLTFST